MTVGAFQCRYDVRQDVLPCLHVNCEDSEADTELHPNRTGSSGVMLQEQKDLVSKRRQLRI